MAMTTKVAVAAVVVVAAVAVVAVVAVVVAVVAAAVHRTETALRKDGTCEKTHQCYTSNSCNKTMEKQQ